ncbi:MAG TPA: hypothetical protein VK742_12745 [Candidatus Sulfotelmatobacter sp.]|jgi:hypothetical protein|nr:hypothetical protein [Candidatus Sulfotelmatobacter sp.]
MNEKPKSKLRWRLLRWGLIGLAVLVTLAAALLTEENWRGKHAWENYKRAAEARGDKLDLASVIPPAVPDDQNFFCAPIVAEALSHLGDNFSGSAQKMDFRMNFQIYRGDMANWINKGGYWQKGIMTDLTEWQRAIRKFNNTAEGKTNGFPASAQPQSPAADVLTALSVYNPALEELRQAAARPGARLPLDYEDGFDAATKMLPWLAETKRCAQFLELRTVAEVQDGQGAAALADSKLLLRVNDSLRQPFLITFLVRIAIQAISLQPIYEGLAQHRWNEAQLAELENTLTTQDFLADSLASLRGEKVFTIDDLEKQRITRLMIYSDGKQVITNHMSAMPAAYFYQNQFWFAQLNDRYTALIDMTNRVLSPSAFKRLNEEMEAAKKHYSIYKVQALMTVPAIWATILKVARIQTEVDLATVACALERFRLAHGSYPETLDALAPQFIEKLPNDIVNGQPLHYRRTDDGKFVLWSIGPDEKDDGGTVFLTKSGAIDQKRGDWVWKN